MLSNRDIRKIWAFRLIIKITSGYLYYPPGKSPLNGSIFSFVNVYPLDCDVSSG